MAMYAFLRLGSHAYCSHLDWSNCLADEPYTCAGLKLPLHAYQRHALAWMCWRERAGAGTSSSRQQARALDFDMGGDTAGSSMDTSMDAEAAAVFESDGMCTLHPCWQPVTLPSGLRIFENRYTGISGQHLSPRLHASLLDTCTWLVYAESRCASV